MEQLLNLFAVLVALTVIGGWLRHRRRLQRGPHQVRLVWQVLAISLVVLFLFFAISISDDLHWSVIATEAEGSRKLLKNIAARTPASSIHVHVAALLVAVAPPLAPGTPEIADPVFCAGSPAAGISPGFSGRSPPSFD
jgi:hypothetical protein